MFSSVLVANRGEIACRIFRTARKLGIRTIAVCSEADRGALFTRMADETRCIGPASPRESYLNGQAILAAARESGAEAIHPGYGFLSENPDFADSVIEAGLIWIGPRPEMIRAMGLKDEAKAIATRAGVPVVPGFQSADQDPQILAKAAEELGFPILIKALAGGGGRGIREVESADGFAEALASAQREASGAFGDARVLLEKRIVRPRHVEVQILGDHHGNVVHLFERDCSLQRRRQKVIEEAPAFGLPEALRANLLESALRIARAVGYQNAGTVEFVVAGDPVPERYYFLEMNTRLQVEHPVTECITGINLVEWQLRVAAGEPLGFLQTDITLRGHAIEARICAEDPDADFRPRIGRIRRFDIDLNPAEPGARLRLDHGFEAGDAVPGAYDSLVAKLIAFSPSGRAGAISALLAGLDSTAISGIGSTAGFLRNCLTSPGFTSGAVHTGLIGESLAVLTDRSHKRRKAAACCALDQWARMRNETAGFRVNLPAQNLWRAVDDSGEIAVEIRLGEAFIDGAAVSLPKTPPIFMAPGGALDIWLEGEGFRFSPMGALAEMDHALAGDVLKAPMPGKVAALRTHLGAEVRKGEVLIVFEAMKMELPLSAPRDGTVEFLDVETGIQRKEGDILLRLAELPMP